MVHFFFYVYEIGGANWFVKVDVIVKTIFNSWTIDKFCVWPDTAYSFGHYVGAAMPDYFKTFIVFESDNPDGGIGGDRRG
ncbi:hypothetical protein ES703_96843 [subsurface metagenome]